MERKVVSRADTYIASARKKDLINCTYIHRIKTLEDAYKLSVLIANDTNSPNENLVICELLNNAIEHGNLGISYRLKSKLLSENRFLSEIEQRLHSPKYRNKYAEVKIQYLPDLLIVIISDQGKGFPFEKYLSIDSQRVTEFHGRGIAIANSLLKIEYQGKGNKVKVFLNR